MKSAIDSNSRGPSWLAFLCLSLLGLAILGSTAAHADRGKSGKQAKSAKAKSKEVESAKVLLDRFASLKAFSASFVEKKHLRVLAMPIETSGSVRYTAPDVLLRTTKRPATRLVIDSKSLSYQDGVSKKDLPLDKKHPARAFVQIFLDLVRGDRGAIEKSFQVEFARVESEWELTLTPLNTKAMGAIKSIKLRGKGLLVSWMQIIDRHGDRTETLFSDVKLTYSSAP